MYTLSAQQVSLVRAFLNRTYTWMTAGLILTAGIAYISANNESLLNFAIQNRFMLIIAQFALVMGISWLLPRLSGALVGGLFLLYAALTGLSFSALFLAYSQSAIFSAFISSAGLFAVMSGLGYFTKMDLTRVGNIALVGLIGIIIAGLVNIFLGNGLLSLIISVLGVVIFSALTAYDTQKLKEMALGISQDEDGQFVSSDGGERLAVYGALTLYLDLINLFLFMLRLFGGGSRN